MSNTIPAFPQQSVVKSFAFNNFTIFLQGADSSKNIAPSLAQSAIKDGGHSPFTPRPKGGGGGKFGLLLAGSALIYGAYKTGVFDKIFRMFKQPDLTPKLNPETDYKPISPKELAKRAIEDDPEQGGIRRIKTTPKDDTKPQEQDCEKHWIKLAKKLSRYADGTLEKALRIIKIHDWSNEYGDAIIRKNYDIKNLGYKSSKPWYVMIKRYLCDYTTEMPRDCAIELVRRMMKAQGLENLLKDPAYDLQKMLNECKDLNDPNLDLNEDGTKRAFQ